MMMSIFGPLLIATLLLLIYAAIMWRTMRADGLGIDRAVAAAWFGAKNGETVSLTVALWNADKASKHYKAGCRWCWFLNYAVQRNHCPLQLAPGAPATPLFDGFRALICLFLLLVAHVLVFVGFWHLCMWIWSVI